MDEQVRILREQLEAERQARDRIERELRGERDFIARLIDTAQAVVLVVDEGRRIVRANAFAARISGVPAASLVGRDAAEIFFVAEARASARDLLRLARTQAHGDAGTIPLDTAEGERRDFGWFHSVLPDPSSPSSLLLLLVGRDMTERERLFREVQRLSTTDPLTGLSNRRHLDTTGQLEVLRARRHRRPLSAVMLDVDRFKEVNDAHGHAAGDRVLVALAGLCASMSRRTDLKARVGGDEFCLLLPETGPSAAHQLTERIRAELQGLPFEEGGKAFRVSASMGVAGHLADESLEGLLARADRALYVAKESGRNRVVLADGLATVPVPSS